MVQKQIKNIRKKMKKSKHVTKIVSLEITGADLIEQPLLPFAIVMFHYNVHTELWYCIKRENCADYFNGFNKDKIGNGPTLPEAYRDLYYKKL